VAWIRLTVLAAVVALALAGAQSSLGNERQEPCNWGASSIAGNLVNGEFVVTAGPTTTGCIPR
jgi:hypothetical protein